MKISGTGCCLIDYLYSGIDFNGKKFSKYLSKREGDGGLSPGKLVFTEEFERFAEKKFDIVLEELVGDRSPDVHNIGGPSIVALIHAAQLLGENAIVQFYGSLGKDHTGNRIIDIINQTPVSSSNIKRMDQPSPYTYVFSDPNWHDGHGERTFINNIGAAWQLSPRDLDDSFFRSDIVEFGGTAILPNIHDQLTDVLKKSKKAGSITIVNTVYDFRSEKANPGGKWPLGDSEESFRYIDILLMDLEEALKISGTGNIDSATHYYAEKGVSAFAITNGASPVWLYSDGRLFRKLSITQLPVSESILNELKFNTGIRGDTTGCGDNFVGGIIASVAWQLSGSKAGNLNLIEACSWGIVSGGFACFYMGGTYIERRNEEKLNLLRPYYELYRNQIHSDY
ncbi:MAG: hypothetical protein AMS27_09005 [Bacteroides sp. SM23_62_1]|nr:MAG: hypothetical protein AMS27_09005 [Bacteroides sp. SM23_62_1]